MPLPAWMMQPDPAATTPAAGGGLPEWMTKKAQPTIGEDIEATAPRALRTGMELVPAGPAEASAGAPWLIRKVLSAMNDMGLVRGGEQTMSDFDKAYGNVAFGQQVRPALGLEGVRKLTDPILGEGQDVPAQTFPGKVVQTGLEVAPSVFAGPGSLAQKAMTSGGAALGTEGAGAAAEALGASPGWVEAAKLGGSLLGGVSPPGTFNRLSRPRPIPPSRQPHIDVMRAHGVPLSAAQRTANPRLLAAEDVAGGTAAQERQGQAFTRAAANVQGGFPRGTSAFTRPAMRQELDRMGAEFDRLTANSTTPFDQPLQNDLINTAVSYTRDNPLVAPVVEDVMNDLASNAAGNGGVLTGAGYASARSKINEKIRSEATDDGVRAAMIDFQDALDDAVGRNLSPEDQHAFRQVRGQYRNFLPIERAKASPGAGAAEGFINPAQLKAGIKATQGRREVAAGENPLTDLAESGTVTMNKTANSGTNPRQRASLAGLIPLAAAAASGGAGMLGGLGGPGGALLGGTAGLAAAGFPALRDAWITSRPGQAFLGRQGPTVSTDRQMLSAMIAAAQAERARRERR
ncbi:hypothetical protein NKG99_20390 [Mesorhizobium sp. M1409]|uniref:hypothetical protein n=1 Tax=Mesorhizobium sp. M1409 TaxID=2957100 RepID=UPI00333D4C03